eukprot:7018949-Karenia_brevis.AAC.1
MKVDGDNGWFSSGEQPLMQQQQLVSPSVLHELSGQLHGLFGPGGIQCTPRGLNPTSSQFLPKSQAPCSMVRQALPWSPPRLTLAPMTALHSDGKNVHVKKENVVALVPKATQ